MIRPDMAWKYSEKYIPPLINDIDGAGVYTCSEPMHAYKGVTGGFVELILPEGATYVVPEGQADRPYPNRRRKWRADEVFVADGWTNTLFPSSPYRDRSDSICYFKWRHITNDLDESTQQTCTDGIHFCPTAGEAVEGFADL